MADLEDRLLGHKLNNYCSSSEGEEEPHIPNSKDTILKPYEYIGTSQQTGPKGVLEDFKDYEKYKKEQIAKRDKKLLDDLNQSAITAMTQIDEENLTSKLANIEKKVEEYMDDDDKEFFEQYKKKKINEILSKLSNMPKYNHLYFIKSGEEFLTAIDKEPPSVTIVIFLYKDDQMSKQIIGLLEKFAQKYPYTKFCCADSLIPGISKNFSSKGVPALLVYRAGELISSFVRMQDNFDCHIGFDELDNFLKDNGILIPFEI